MNVGMLNLEHIKNYLRIDTDEDDHLILALLNSSKEYILSYTGMQMQELEEKSSLVPAILILVSSLYDNRTLETIGKVSTQKIDLVNNMLSLYCKNNIAY